MFMSNGRAESFGAVGVGGLSVGVPGVLRMLEDAHRKHGRLPWARLFEPAIKLADDGFEVSPRLHALLDGFKRFARGDDFRRHYYDAAGEPWPVGYRLKNPEYAATLRTLAKDGAGAMYSGDLAAAIASKVRDNNVRPGRLTRDDLASYYRSRVRAAVLAVSRVAGVRTAAAVVGRRHDSADPADARRLRARRSPRKAGRTRFT